MSSKNIAIVAAIIVAIIAIAAAAFILTNNGNGGDDTVKVQSVSLDRTEASLVVGTNITLNATVKPTDAKDKSVAWSTSNASVATVSSGKVTAVSPGAAVITVTTNDGGYKATCTVTVTQNAVKVTGVTLDKTQASLSQGESVTLAATVVPSNATDKGVKWATSNTSVATVSNGKVTAVSPGTAIITVTTDDGGFTSQCEVTVTSNVVKVTGVSLDKEQATVFQGESVTLAATVSPSNAANKSVVWTSSNTSVATVSSGKVTGVSPGTALILATTEDSGFMAACNVTVKSPTDDKVLNEGYVFEVDTVARVYGNANNDDRIDSKDVEFIQNIIDKKITFNKSINPYADANYDGVIDSKDIAQVNMIISKSRGTVWYENYYKEVQSIDFPVTGKKIGVTYWQQAQLIDLVGHWDDVVAANASVTQARSNQYDLSNITYSYGTTGSSKLTEEFCEGYAQAGVDLIIGSPYKGTVTEVANTYLPNVPVITLGIGGASCVSSALTLGILMDAEERAQKYEEYVLGIIDTVKEGLSTVKNSEKPKMLVTRMYEDNDGYISRYGGILVNCANTDGSYQLLSMFADLYTDNSETSTTPNRTQEWILSQDFDLIFDMEVYTGFQTSSIPGEQFYTQGEYNKRFENSVEYFKGTKAYNNGGVLSSSYIFDGYSGFASLMMSAHMIYPELFTLRQGQDSLQYWYDNFTVTDVDVRTQGGYYYTGDKYTTKVAAHDSSLKGYYRWDPAVVTVDGNYSNCTPAFMDIAQEVFETVYGKLPDCSGITRESIPAEYLYPYNPYVTKNGDGTLTVKTFDNTSVGTSEAYADKVIRFTPTKVLCYTDAYVDTIYMILCDYYGETAHSGNTPNAYAALWNLIDAMPSSVKSGVISKYGLDVPDSVKVIGTGKEDLLGYCGSFPSSEKLIVLMSEYNIRSTNTSSWWGTNTTIESNASNIQFIYLLSNSPAMVLSTIEMLGKVIGYESTDSMMDGILAKIYMMQKTIDDSYRPKTFFVEMANGNSVGSNTLMGGIFASVLKMDNVFDGSLMGSKMSDEDVIKAQPDVIGFYKADTRSMDEKMRAA